MPNSGTARCAGGRGPGDHGAHARRPCGYLVGLPSDELDGDEGAVAAVDRLTHHSESTASVSTSSRVKHPPTSSATGPPNRLHTQDFNRDDPSMDVRLIGSLWTGCLGRHRTEQLGIPADLRKRRYPPLESRQVSRNRGYLTAHRRGHVRPQQPDPDVVGLDDAASRRRAHPRGRRTPLRQPRHPGVPVRARRQAAADAERLPRRDVGRPRRPRLVAAHP